MSTRLITLALAAAAATASPLAHQRRAAAPVIVSCTVPNTIALTFDDGPFLYTDSVLDQLDAAGMKATFFLNGKNWGDIYAYADTVQRADSAGHQIGSHTWSHPHMTQLDAAGVTEEMTQVEDALLDIIGKFPTYMRPPYFEWDDSTLEVLGEMGYKVIHADLDTNDWKFDMPASIAAFESGIADGGSLVLAHDVHPSTANMLVPAMISAVQEAGLRAVTVGECLGDPVSNWYRTSDDGSEPEPSETPTPSEPSETPTPSDPSESSETPTPSESSEPSETPTTSDPSKPSETSTPTDTSEPSATPTDGTDPSNTPKPTDSSEPSATSTDGADPSATPSPTDDGTYPEPTPTKTPGKGCRAKRHRRNAKTKKAKRSALN